MGWLSEEEEDAGFTALNCSASTSETMGIITGCPPDY